MSAAIYELAQRAADALIGTPNVIESLGEEFKEAENNSLFCNALESLIFCCDTCGWWCDISEMSNTEDWICDDCEEP